MLVRLVKPYKNHNAGDMLDVSDGVRDDLERAGCLTKGPAAVPEPGVAPGPSTLPRTKAVPAPAKDKKVRRAPASK